jgi:hypothetical protein
VLRRDQPWMNDDPSPHDLVVVVALVKVLPADLGHEQAAPGAPIQWQETLELSFDTAES